MPTDVNVSAAITVGVSVPATSSAAFVYVDAPITVGIIVSPTYIVPTPVPAPAGLVVAPILLSQKVMPTPTISNGRPI